MNEEEKKAVGLLKALNNLEKKCKIEKVPYKSEIKKIRISLLPEDYGIFEILLNLIEKLQKENEELKNEVMEKDLEIIGKEEYTKASMGEIIEQYYTANEDCISIQKIKYKIEELDEELEIMKVDNMYGRYKEYGGKSKWERLFATKYGMHDALQELLKGRK